MRKLPVYLLLDTSGSMQGEPLEALKNGVQTLVGSLRQDPYALESVHLSLISFDREARLLMPLTPLESFILPEIKAPDSGPTHLGAALELLLERVSHEVLPHSADHKGDWKPLLFVLTDGSPSDTQVYQQACANIQRKGFAMVMACAAGPRAKTEPLGLLTTHVFRMDTLDSHSFSQFFKWVSASVASDNRSVGLGGLTTPALPPPPDHLQIVL